MSESYLEPKKPLLSDKFYNTLKALSTIILTAVSALYFALGQIWEFPRMEQVLGSIAAVTVFLGALMGLSTKSYNEHRHVGNINIIREPEGKKVYSLELKGDAEDLDTMTEATFKIGN